MLKNELIKKEGAIYRCLATENDAVLLIDCMKQAMTKWQNLGRLDSCEPSTEEELLNATGMVLAEEQELKPEARSIAHERYTIIASIRPFLEDEKNCR